MAKLSSLKSQLPKENAGFIKAADLQVYNIAFDITGYEQTEKANLMNPLQVDKIILWYCTIADSGTSTEYGQGDSFKLQTSLTPYWSSIITVFDDLADDESLEECYMERKQFEDKAGKTISYYRLTDAPTVEIKIETEEAPF